jgi:hypothetical protein
MIESLVMRVLHRAEVFARMTTVTKRDCTWMRFGEVDAYSLGIAAQVDCFIGMSVSIAVN